MKRKLMHRRHSLNYFYFGFFFLVIALLHVFHVSLVSQGTTHNYLFYMSYALSQCLFEVGVLVLLGAWMEEKFPKRGKIVFIMGTFILFFMHLIDFPLMRIMDMSIWYSFSIVFAESFENFIEMLKASNIHLVTWLLMGVAVGVLTLLGIFIYRWSEKLSQKRPLHFSYAAVSFFSIAVIALMTCMDYKLSPWAAAPNDTHFLKALPWKTTLFTSSYPKLHLTTSLTTPPAESWYSARLRAWDVTSQRKPNIYLFICESMRNDFITPEIAPALSQFRERELKGHYAVSGANATHLSWFSIFHSVYPFAWKERQPSQWLQGSLPLQIFKKGGYKIHVLSASRLNFYQMDKILFGTDPSLVDEFVTFAEEPGKENYVYDTECVDHLIHSMIGEAHGNLFVIFLEGTHFDYSWPPHLTLDSRPTSKGIDYLSITYSRKELEGIKNRYRHAIYHIDTQFNRFLETLNNHSEQHEAVVVFTSDHGEEFFEEGRIFHASNLNRAQTRVPLFMRLPHRVSKATFITHLDIFPTLLDHVFGKVPPWFDGESILQPRQKPFAITTRFNASRPPYEFLITTEEELLVARFDQRSDIRSSKALEIVSRKDSEENLLDTSVGEIHQKYEKILHQFLK